MSKNWLENELRSRFAGKREFVNTEDGWEDLLSRMDDKTPAKSKPNSILYLALLPLFIVTLAGIALVQRNANTLITNVTSEHALQTQNEVIEQERNLTTSAFINESQIDSKIEQTKEINTQSRANNYLSIDQYSEEDETKEIETYSSIENEPQLTVTPKADPTKEEAFKTDLESPNTNIEASGMLTNNTQNIEHLTISNTENDLALSGVRNEVNSITTLSKTLNLLPIADTRLELNLNSVSYKGDPRYSIDKQKNFEIGIGISYGVFGNNLNTNDGRLDAHVESRKITESSLDFMAVELNARYDLTKSVYAIAGLQAKRHNQEFIDLYTNAYTETETVEVVDHLQDGTTQNSSTELMVNHYEQVQNVTYNHYDDISLGLGLGIKTMMSDRFKLFYESMLYYSVFSKSEITTYASAFSFQNYTELNNKNYSRSQGLLTNSHRLGIGINFSDFTTIQLAGELHFDLSNRLRTESLLKDKFYGAGLQISAVRKF